MSYVTNAEPELRPSSAHTNTPFTKPVSQCTLYCFVIVLLFHLQALGASVGYHISRQLYRRSQDDFDDSDRDCLKCQPGSYATQPCFHDRATVCKVCPEGTFTSLPNLADRCQPCSRCGVGLFQVGGVTASNG